MLRFHTLGSFELLEGQPPAVRLIPTQPKRLALLAYLALAHPRGLHRRDTLLALFWPELSGEEARRALRQALHHLRRAVGEGAIETRADDQVRYQEGCLAGVHLPEVSVELEEWVEQTRARLHKTAGQAATALSRRAEQADDLPAAVEAARVACDLQPDDEACARRLMQLLDRRGDRALALQVYERLARRLESEYQTAPSAETAALARSLREMRRDDRAPASATATASHAPPRARWLVPAVLLFVVGVLGAFLFAVARRPVPTLSTGQLAAGSRGIVSDVENRSGARPTGNPGARTLYLLRGGRLGGLRALAIDGETLAYLASLGHAYARAGRTNEARATLARLARASSDRHVSAYHVAAVHVALEDTSSALDWLERAYQEQSPWLAYVAVDPRFGALRSHPRFEDLLRKARLRS